MCQLHRSTNKNHFKQAFHGYTKNSQSTLVKQYTAHGFVLVDMFMEVIAWVIITHGQTIGRDMKTIPLVLCYTLPGKTSGSIWMDY